MLKLKENTEFDIIGLGEVMLRLSAPNKEKISQCEVFEKEAAGTELNVASGAAMLGARSALLTKLPSSKMGHFIRNRIRYGDVALLFRSLKGTAADCSAVLRARGIPVETDAGANLLDAPEIQILVCLLETIDNPRRDISLAGALLSPLCGVSCDRLALLRRRADGERLYETIRDYLAEDDTEGADADDDRARLAAFFADLAQFRAMARCLRAPELIEEICDRLAYVARVCGADRLRRANVERLTHMEHVKDIIQDVAGEI